MRDDKTVRSSALFWGLKLGLVGSVTAADGSTTAYTAAGAVDKSPVDCQPSPGDAMISWMYSWTAFLVTTVVIGESVQD